MVRKRIRKSVAIISVVTLVVTTIMTGCGKKRKEFKEYGNSSTSDAVSVHTLTDSDIKTTSGGTLIDRLGGEPLQYSGEITVNGIPVSINVTSKIMETDTLPIYKVTEITEEDVREEEIVKKIFGNDFRALDSENDVLKSENGDSEEMMYLAMFAMGEDGDPEDPNFETKTWVDSEDYFLHIYEGDIGGAAYQLLISYNRQYHEKSFALYPKNWGDVCGNPTLDKICTTSSDGKVWVGSMPVDAPDIPNECELSDEDMIDKVFDFVQENVFVDLPKSDIGFFSSSWYYYEDESEIQKDAKSEMVFVNDEVLKDANLSGSIRNGYELEYNNTISNQQIIYSTDDIDFSSGMMHQIGDSGIFMVNDLGVIGISLSAQYKFDEMLETDVSILKYEDAMKAFCKAMEENSELSKAIKDEKKYEFKNMKLMYYPIPDGNGTMKMTPVWVGDLERGEDLVAQGIVSAVDGSYINTIFIQY
ncbi:MAG: hypothetical protein IKS48_00795 [Eubacterium sp.]|nr:hypothetical protein [Eubacterium sp.]